MPSLADQASGTTAESPPASAALDASQPEIAESTTLSDPGEPAAGTETDADAGAAATESPSTSTRTAPVDIPTQGDLDAEMEAEINAALEAGEIGAAQPVEPAAEPTEAGELESTPSAADELSEGDKLTGTVESVHEENLFLDFGLRHSGILSLRQFGGKKPPQVGETLQVVVSNIDEDEGLIVCNLPRGAARIAGDWNAVAVGQTVECLVNKTNKGGLEVSVSSLRGFMPASQVDLRYVADLQAFVGRKLPARVTEVNPGRRRLVVSRRALLEEERAAAETELFATLQPGDVRTGTVKTIKDYGAFIDLGGVDGFLHIGQISWTRIEHPSEVLSEEQEVEVKVLSVDTEKKRIGLGMRQLTANPWSNVENKYPKGSTQNGTVTRTEPFGAFVELEPGVEGLVHISELDHRRVKQVTEVLNVGQQANVQVLEVDPKRKRISLSVKALTAAPTADAGPSDEDLAPGRGETYQRRRSGKLKGGTGGKTRGGLFGDPRDFS